MDKQVADCVKLLVNILPLRKSEVEGKLFIPHAYMAACDGAVIGRFVTVNRGFYSFVPFVHPRNFFLWLDFEDVWTADGCEMEITMIPGDYDVCMKELQRITNGTFNLEVRISSDPSSRNLLGHIYPGWYLIFFSIIF